MPALSLRPRPLAMSRRALIASLIGACGGGACRAVRSAAGLPPPLEDIAERYVRLTLQLAQHQPTLVEASFAPASWRPGPRTPIAGTFAAIRDLTAAADRALDEARARGGDDFTRARYLAGQMHALLTAARRLAGQAMRFADEARDAFGIEWRAQTSDAAMRARRTLDALLPGAGTLAERYTSFRLRHRMPTERVVPAFRAAMEECRRRVLAQLALPDGERVDIAGEPDAALEAQAVYAGGLRTRVALATAGPVDVAHLVWLAAHETYAGHHLQYVLAERDCVRARMWVERTLHPDFGPHVLVAEGAAEAGAALLLDGDAFREICGIVTTTAGAPPGAVDELIAAHRLIAELETAVPLVAQAYLDSLIGGDAAAERLRDEALVPEPRQLLAAIERRRTRVLAYPEGRRLVLERVRAAGGMADQWRRLTEISTTLTLPLLPT